MKCFDNYLGARSAVVPTDTSKDETGNKVIGTTKISVKNIPEQMDDIVIFTPGADVNQYVTNSVVVNGKIYQDDGSYAEATNRLLDKQ